MFETSAKLGTNIDTAVMALMREVLHHREFAAQNKGDGVQESARYRNESERKVFPVFMWSAVFMLRPDFPPPECWIFRAI